MLRSCAPREEHNEESVANIVSEIEMQTSFDSFTDSQELVNKDSVDQTEKEEGCVNPHAQTKRLAIAIVENPPDRKDASTMTDINLELELQRGKEPEQLFGELVTSMLKRKPEPQKDNFMLKIMTILSRPNLNSL